MTETERMIAELASDNTTAAQIVAAIGCDKATVYRCVERYGLRLKQRKKPAPRSDLKEKIVALSAAHKTSAEIASELGCSAKHVQNVLRVADAVRLPRGAQCGEKNPAYLVGRRIDLDGYVLVSAPGSHPYARSRVGRNAKLMYEHRLVMERELGRYLLPSEVVDHIDGLHLHNAPNNLRLFGSNAEHLKQTITGQVPLWSLQGVDNMRTTPSLRKDLERVDTYGQRKKLGVVRLQQILLAASQLGIDSPYLLGTIPHLVKAQIDFSSPTKIQQALDRLENQFAVGRFPSIPKSRP